MLDAQINSLHSLFPVAGLQQRDCNRRHRELELMREGAMLINFARGEVIDKQVRLITFM